MNTGNQRSLQHQNQHISREPRGDSEVNERETKKDCQDVDHGRCENVNIRIFRTPIVAPKRRNCGTRSNRNRAISVSIPANAPASVKSVAMKTKVPAAGPKT